MNGATSQNDATVTLNAVPTQGLHVQLTWTSSRDDIDLHLFHGQSPGWCSATNDCSYASCGDPNDGFFYTVEFDGQNGQTAGDPTLDIDDICGNGPENINIDTQVNGTYLIGVDAYGSGATCSGPGALEATDLSVKIFVGGALVSDQTNHFSSVHQFWRVARVDVNGTTTVTPIDTVSSNEGGACL